MFNALSGLVTSAQKLQNSANNLANSKDLGLGINKVTAALQLRTSFLLGFR